MPGKVVRVRRRERLGWAQRLYLPMIFVGIGVTSRVFFRNLWGYIVLNRDTCYSVMPDRSPVRSIFISHASADRALAVLLATHIEASGSDIKTFVASRSGDI